VSGGAKQKEISRPTIPAITGAPKIIFGGHPSAPSCARTEAMYVSVSTNGTTKAKA
jgi:hypothetical protein